MLVWLIWGHWRAIKCLSEDFFGVLIDLPQVCLAGHKARLVSQGMLMDKRAD